VHDGNVNDAPNAKLAGEALRQLLTDAAVPEHRVELACAATDLLLRRAIVRHDDGSAYVITGDIRAMWLRDSTAQVTPLLALAPHVPGLADLVRGVLRTQVRQVLVDPRANAFNDGPTRAAMRRDFRDQSPWVFERKYALDSLCAPLTLAWQLWHATGSTEHVSAGFREAARTIVAFWRAEQEHDPGSYRFRRLLARRRDSLPHDGRGAPVAYTGMTWSGFRPGDDACSLGYHIPANALAAVSLRRLAALLEASGDGTAAAARALAAEIDAGIRRHGIVELPGGEIYAYEVDGLGGVALLDDANVPSLLSLPYLGYCSPSDPLYLATRRWVLGPANPNWSVGTAIRGVGSAHTPRGWVWPLAVIVEGLTATDDEQREAALRRVEATVAPGGLFHESVHPSRPGRFTRPWFSWADMLYVELVLVAAGVTRPTQDARLFVSKP
jgi:meiotically up-regulated gene 157 (Mug157) protein